MNDQEWMSFIDGMTPAHRKIAQGVLARLQYVLERFRSETLREQQAQARRSDGNAARINQALQEIERLKEHLGLGDGAPSG